MQEIIIKDRKRLINKLAFEARQDMRKKGFVEATRNSCTIKVVVKGYWLPSGDKKVYTQQTIYFVKAKININIPNVDSSELRKL